MQPKSSLGIHSTGPCDRFDWDSQCPSYYGPIGFKHSCQPYYVGSLTAIGLLSCFTFKRLFEMVTRNRLELPVLGMLVVLLAAADALAAFLPEALEK